MEDPDTSLSVVRNGLTGDAPLDTAVSRAILQRVSDGSLPETLQVGLPHRVMAFGKHDTLSGGFSEAEGIARAHGYDPTIRIAGGRAVAFSPTIVRFAWSIPVAQPAPTMHARFRTLADAVVKMLDRFGVEGTVGEIRDEYCAGEYSVNILGSRKVMGVGQRLSRSAAQVGGMIVVSDPDDINAVLVPIYGALGVPINPEATGSISDAIEVEPDAVIDAFVVEIAAGRNTEPARVDADTLRAANDLRSTHDPARRT